MPLTASPPQLTSTSSLAAAMGLAPVAARIDLALGPLDELLQLVQTIATLAHDPIS